MKKAKPTWITCHPVWLSVEISLIGGIAHGFLTASPAIKGEVRKFVTAVLEGDHKGTGMEFAHQDPESPGDTKHLFVAFDAVASVMIKQIHGGLDNELKYRD